MKKSAAFWEISFQRLKDKIIKHGTADVLDTDGYRIDIRWRFLINL